MLYLCVIGTVTTKAMILATWSVIIHLSSVDLWLHYNLSGVSQHKLILYLGNKSVSLNINLATILIPGMKCGFSDIFSAWTHFERIFFSALSPSFPSCLAPSLLLSHPSLKAVVPNHRVLSRIMIVRKNVPLLHRKYLHYLPFRLITTWSKVFGVIFKSLSHLFEEKTRGIVTYFLWAACGGHRLSVLIFCVFVFLHGEQRRVKSNR